MTERPHYRLEAWRASLDRVKRLYKWPAQFPVDERCGLTMQLRRAAVSVPSYIAEGAVRDGSRGFARFLGIARGSLSELETQYLLAVALGFAAPAP